MLFKMILYWLIRNGLIYNLSSVLKLSGEENSSHGLVGLILEANPNLAI
jgi:hypothetical protein